MDQDHKYLKIEIQKYIDQELKHQGEKQAIINDKNTEALNKAAREIDRRLEGMNQFEKKMSDMTRSYVTRDDLDNKETVFNQRLFGIEKDIKIHSKIIYTIIGIAILLEVLIKLVFK